MNKIIFSLMSLSMVLVARPQLTQVKNSNAKDKYLVTPGMGMGRLKLGMNEKEVENLLGIKLTWKNYKEEMKVFKDDNADLAIDSMLQFVLGFDHCGRVDKEKSKEVPLFKCYFLNHHLNYFTLSSYVADPLQQAKLIMKNGTRFLDNMDSVLDRFKTSYLKVPYGDYSGDHIYYEEGVELMFDKFQLTVITIFTPEINLPELINNKRDQLIREFKAL